MAAFDRDSILALGWWRDEWISRMTEWDIKSLEPARRPHHSQQRTLAEDVGAWDCCLNSNLLRGENLKSNLGVSSPGAA